MENHDDEVKLIRPEKRYLLSYLEGCRESFATIHDPYILHDPDTFESWKDTIFEEYEKSAAGIDLPEGYVPSITYWLVNDREFIGTVNMRLWLSPALADYGGHLGCFIRTSMRHSGYGNKAFELGMEKARQHHISPVLLTCTEANLPSRTMLSRLPYDRMEVDHAVVDGVDQPIRRFFFS